MVENDEVWEINERLLGDFERGDFDLLFGSWRFLLLVKGLCLFALESCLNMNLFNYLDLLNIDKNNFNSLKMSMPSLGTEGSQMSRRVYYIKKKKIP